MKHLLLCIAALVISCAASGTAATGETTRAAPGPAASSTTPVVAAAEFAVRTYVQESTRANGVVCVELDGGEDPGKVLDRLSPLAGHLSADRKDCLGRAEPAAILSIGPAQVAGDRARVDVGVVLGSAGMLELERQEGAWVVVRAATAWISLR